MDNVSKHLSVACLQYTSTKDEMLTLKIIKQLIEKAIDLGAEFIALPECATSLHENSTITKNLAKPEVENFSLQVLKKLAKSKGIYILIGSLPIKLGNKITNRSFLIGSNGKILYKYDKIHLYDVNLPNGEIYKESDTYSSGDKAIVGQIEENKFKIGMTICYDLRFPNLYQDLARNGAEIITVPSAFSNVTGPCHWHTLLKARAIETGSFIIAPAQTGKHQCGRKTFGHSLIISPWGKVLVDGKKKVGVVHAKINLEEVTMARRAIPNLSINKEYSTNT
ncbi:carbon-nitrogen hydrolase family protein [Alphaproteobacteria bacterium]|nr:carbon-nitrogen hydrolase family protein [Alphaproteobacteria bacterium]